MDHCLALDLAMREQSVACRMLQVLVASTTMHPFCSPSLSLLQSRAEQNHKERLLCRLGSASQVRTMQLPTCSTLGHDYCWARLVLR